MASNVLFYVFSVRRLAEEAHAPVYRINQEKNVDHVVLLALPLSTQPTASLQYIYRFLCFYRIDVLLEPVLLSEVLIRVCILRWRDVRHWASEPVCKIRRSIDQYALEV